MIKPSEFFKACQDLDISFYSGVPDSLLKDICAYITENVSEKEHIIAANEGAALAMAAGNYMATGKIPFVYLQNSGFGNLINPLLSITDDKVYAIPAILMIGWRGEPNVKDEPQHIRQGEVMEDLLTSSKTPYFILDKESDYASILAEAYQKTRDLQKPVAILVKKGSFESYSLTEDSVEHTFELNREGAVKLIIDNLTDQDVVVSTTGKTSREVFEYREELKQDHSRDFLTVGAMGHTVAIAAGVALADNSRNVYCMDGDGSVIMHMGTLAVNGQLKALSNLKHIVINNGAHDSVGGQPTVGFKIDFSKIAQACGYSFTYTASTTAEIEIGLQKLREHEGLGFLEIKVNKGARADLGRPTTTPVENKLAYQKFLGL